MIMLFTKKKVFAVSEKIVKEDILDQSGEILVKINLRLPILECPKNDPLLKSAVPFYEKLNESFLEFAKVALKESAEKAKNRSSDTFVPFGAVAKFKVERDTDEHLTITEEFSVSNGKPEPFTESKTQIWDRKTGTLCKII